MGKKEEFTVYGKEAMVDAIYDEIKELGDTVPASVQDVTKKAISKILDIEKSLIKGAVADGDKVRYIGFGTYEKRHRQARKGRNPQDGSDIEIPAKDVPAFSPGKEFKDTVDAPKAKKKATTTKKKK